MKHTDHLNLSLYESNDKFKITGETNSLNANMEILDSSFNELSNSAEKKATLYKLFFDGSDIYRTYSDWEQGSDPMTFSEIYDLCYEAKNMVYIGDGQMKYYPQLDLNVPSMDSESITFMSSAQLNGQNLHTRIIINANNAIKTDQIVDASTKDLSSTNHAVSYVDNKVDNATDSLRGIVYREATDDSSARIKDVAFDGAIVAKDGVHRWATMQRLGGMSRKSRNLVISTPGSTTLNGITYTTNDDGSLTIQGTATGNVYIRLPLREIVTKCTVSLFNKELVTWAEGDPAFICRMRYNGSVVDGSSRNVTSTYFTMQHDIDGACFDELELRVGSGLTFDGTYYPMVESGIVSSTFEPGFSEIVNGSVRSIISTGRNLFTDTDYRGRKIDGLSVSGIALSLDDSGKLTMNGIATARAYVTIPLAKPIMAFTAQYNNAVSNPGITIRYKDRFSTVYGSTTLSSSNVTKVYLPDSPMVIVEIRIESGTILDNYVLYPMVEEGSEFSEFEPYKAIKKNVSSAVISKCPDYGLGVSDDCYNYIDFETKKYHHKVGSFDMGSAAYSKVTNDDGTVLFVSSGFGERYPTSNGIPIRALNSKYKTVNYTYITTNCASVDGYDDKCISARSVGKESLGGLAIYDSEYSGLSKTEIQTALSGVILYVELKNEEVIDLDSVLLDDDCQIEVAGGGHLSFDYGSEHEIDIPSSVVYGINDTSDLEERVVDAVLPMFNELRMNRAWTLKRTITESEIRDGPAYVDLSGCTEMFIYASGNATGSAHLLSNGKLLINDILTSTSKTACAHFVDFGLGIECISAKYASGTNSDKPTGNAKAATQFGQSYKISNITNFTINGVDNLTDCTITVYGR